MVDDALETRPHGLTGFKIHLQGTYTQEDSKNEAGGGLTRLTLILRPTAGMDALRHHCIAVYVLISWGS